MAKVDQTTISEFHSLQNETVLGVNRMPSVARFDIYRFQILPVTQAIQLQFGDEELNVEQLRERKNDFFRDAIIDPAGFSWSRADLRHRVLYDSNSKIVLQIAADRVLRRGTPEFTEEFLDDWPTALVYVDNRPDRQLMAIQVEHRAFRKPSTLAKLIENSVNERLVRRLLHVTILPVFDQRDFWDLVDRYRGQITQARFDMVTPNMSNISRNLRLDLQSLGRETDTQQTRLELNSDKRAQLTLPRNNEMLSSLVEYIADGGGTASLKVHNLRYRVSTKESVKEIDIGELELGQLTGGQVAQLIQRISGEIGD